MPKKAKAKHACERDCEHFLEVEKKKKDGTIERVLCNCTGVARVRAAPAKAHHISCPDHPDYKLAVGDKGFNSALHHS